MQPDILPTSDSILKEKSETASGIFSKFLHVNFPPASQEKPCKLTKYNELLLSTQFTIFMTIFPIISASIVTSV